MSHADLQACRAMMRTGSRSFFMASLSLPKSVRAPATALYAFCRVADDAIDLSAQPTEALAQLRKRLDAIYANQPSPEVADRALAEVVHSKALPRALLDALLEGFAWDAAGLRYETLEDLHAYGARVAGTVGAMMAVVMEVRNPLALARACELGVAMQLTNIARDVGEDARNGRLYLPQSWLREEGLDPDTWLATPVFDARMARLVQRLLAEADRLYARAECGIAELPRNCRPAIHAARLLYAEIGHALAKSGLDSVHHRTVVGGWRKLALVLRSCNALWVSPGHPMLAGSASAPLAAVRFLVDAAASADLPDRTFYQRTLRMISLFERQEQRHRGALNA